MIDRGCICLHPQGGRGGNQCERSYSYGKYMNHSCNHNCIAEKWTIDGKPRVKIVVDQNIQCGDELTWDYQWASNVNHPQTVCKCGSKKCHGYLEK